MEMPHLGYSFQVHERSIRKPLPMTRIADLVPKYRDGQV
jgi:hypothetical protein